MPRPSKSVNSLRGHRTKLEIEIRKQAENNLKTGEKMREFKEVKSDKVAHKEFLRVQKLMSSNDKDDDLYSAVINRYCMLHSECRAFEKLKSSYDKLIDELVADKEKVVKDYAPPEDTSERMSLTAYYNLKGTFTKAITSLDDAILRKRKMMFDIEKENLMTVASGLRSIPKTPAEDKKSPLEDILNGSG